MINKFRAVIIVFPSFKIEKKKKMAFSSLPTFDELENKKIFWPAEPGSKDEGLGMLRYLTPAHVAGVVRSEVKTGERVCLNWDMTKLETPGMGGGPFSKSYSLSL